ncbi:MAG: response regulator transcription factor [Hyphomicrobiales bacterium]|nr:response regulator transcription factor [Hyphomicrobiales bacterium]
MKLLVIEDDVPLRSLVVEHFTALDFVVDGVGRADEARAALAVSSYDLMLLDLGLPDGTGEALLREVRARTGSSLPVIIFTARDAFEDRIALLNAGADDFVLKPFDLLELEARIRAVLRRPGARERGLLVSGNLSFDIGSRAPSVDGREFSVTKREAALLEELMRAGEHTVVREALEDRLYAFSEPVTPNALEALVSRLRRRLSSVKASVEIETKRGIGYRLISDRASQ